MADANEFAYESLEDGASIGVYLNALADGFARGVLSLASGEEELTFHPQGLLHFGVRAVRRARHARIVLEVDWRIAPASDEKPRPLEIRSPNA